MPLRYLITGATGFVGSHVVRACQNYGYQVATIARPSSDTAALRDSGVLIHAGDLTDSQVVRQALEDVDVVVHCAAQVGGGGTLADYRRSNVEALRLLLDGCKGHALERFVHLSCTTVYAVRHYHGADEDEPLPAHHRDPCAQSKMEAERVAVAYYRDFGVPVVVLRAGCIYGPRERHFMPWLIHQLQQGTFRYIGAPGRTALDSLFVRNLVDAVFLAADNPDAVGKVFNLNDGEYISKQAFVEAVASGLDLPLPRSSISLYWARWRTWCAEALAHWRNNSAPPRWTTAQLRLLGMNLDFSSDRARQHLGYRPRVPFADGIAETIAWYRPRKIIEAKISG